MKLSQLVRAKGAARTFDEILQWQIQKLISMDEPCWRLAGRLAVFLQRRGYNNAAKRVQLAATEENPEALAAVLQDLRADKGIFPAP